MGGAMNQTSQQFQYKHIYSFRYTAYPEKLLQPLNEFMIDQ